MKPSDKIMAEIRAHAERDYPRECCGLVVVRKGRHRYVPVRNVAERNEHFVMHPDDQAAAEDMGEVVLVVHSHPNLPPLPSMADLIGCEASGLPWLIVNWPTGAVHQFAPTGYVAPLYGRTFSHGVLDCYSFIRDYYRQELGTTLPDFARPDEWWLKGQNLYLEGFAAAGFEKVDGPPKLHDVLLMRVSAPVPNHGAVYLGSGRIGHHQMGRLSSRDVYGGWYEKVTVATLRHGSLL
jgi:proteasome lid subunit RPN8/RPN11